MVAATGNSTEAENDEAPAPVKPKGPGYWKVRVSHPQSNKRTVFRSVSEKRARQWLMNRCPYGEEFYLESPAGHTESYVLNRSNEEDGTDAESWAPFNPEDYVPPGEQVPPGAAGWPDIEG